MSLCTLGMAEGLRGDGVAFNSLWPKTLVATAAVQNVLGGEAALARSRKPEIVADAAHAILLRDSRSCTGNLFLAEAVLAEERITDLSGYAYAGNEAHLEPDLYVDAGVGDARCPPNASRMSPAKMLGTPARLMLSTAISDDDFRPRP